jgi:hypothetical protein
MACMWEEDHMEKQLQKQSEKIAVIRYQSGPLDKPSRHNQTPMQAEEVKQESKDAHAFMGIHSPAVSSEGRTRIAEVAYELYEQRGRKDGHDLEDWFNAERQLMTQGGITTLKW